MFRNFVPFICIAVLSACSVQHDNPDFVYPELKGSAANEWPTLLPTDQLAAQNQASVGNAINPNLSMAARVARLRAKVALLKAYKF